MGRKRSKWVGRAVFAVPIVVIVLLSIVAVLGDVTSGTGTLVVEAQASSGSAALSVTATVSGMTHTTPFNVTLTPGTYNVTYSKLDWYATPPPRLITVVGGKTAYAVGVYNPIPVVISVAQAGPNSTAASAEHGVTPVVWVNNSGGVINLASSAFNVAIAPGANYTGRFSSAGVQRVTILPSGSIVTFDVS